LRGHGLAGAADNMATDHPVAMPPADSSPAHSSPTEPGAETPGHVPHPAAPIAGAAGGCSARQTRPVGLRRDTARYCRPEGKI